MLPSGYGRLDVWLIIVFVMIGPVLVLPADSLLFLYPLVGLGCYLSLPPRPRFVVSILRVVVDTALLSFSYALCPPGFLSL